MKLKRIYDDERGVEPMVMKLLAGIVLLAIGLGIGVTLYRHFGGAASTVLNYSVTLNPSSGTIARGSSGTVSVRVETFEGYNKVVSLSAEGMPDNVSITFSPSSGTPTFGSSMTIQVGSNAPLGTRTITVKATSEDGTKSAIYKLTIS